MGKERPGGTAAKSSETDRLYRQRLKTFNRALKRAQRDLERSYQRLRDCERWQEVEHEGELLKVHSHQLKRGLTSISLIDYALSKEVEIRLNPKLDAKEQVMGRFRECKKLKRGLAYAKSHIERYKSAIIHWQELLSRLEEAVTKEEIDALQPMPSSSSSKKSEPNKEKSPYLRFITAAGDDIFIARNAKDNDKLTFSFGKGSDWWLHAAGVPGAHLILRLKNRDQPPPPESVEDAALLALLHSKAKSRGEAEVHLTQCKYVARTQQKKAGLVQLSKHKIIFVRVNAQRYEAIKKRTSATMQLQ